MKFGIVVFPGSNCDRDMQHVLGNVYGRQVEMIWHKDSSLNQFDNNDCIILPGGFSYGDYLRSGAIARFSPIMKAVKSFASDGGLLIGICNGFQVLCESGLLPGALCHNTQEKYICKNIYIKTATTQSPITRVMTPAQVVKIPIAHGEGRYYANDETLSVIKQNDQILFQYCNAKGEVRPDTNANGSLQNIAGICNKERNVIGMMPHPERAAEAALGNTDGRLLFNSILEPVKTTSEAV